MTTNRFNWRPIQSAPRDGTVIINLSIVTIVGGWSRPIDIAPSVCAVRHVGYWQLARQDASVYIPEVTSCEWWTTPEEYASGVPPIEREWRHTPRYVRQLFCCPFVFIRPLEPRAVYDFTSPIYETVVTWGSGRTPQTWHSASCDATKLDGMHPGYLDGHNVNAMPFRWLSLAEFFPPQVFDDAIAMARRHCEYEIDKFTRLAAGAGTP